MDLRARLARLDSLAGKPRRSAAEPGVSARGRVERLRSVARELGLAPAGPTVEAGVLVGQQVVPIPAADFQGRDLAGLFTAELPDALTRRDLFFLDLETTGLAGGTGTLAFLAGLAWWEGDDFIVRQLLLTDPDHEEALLGMIEQAAEGRRAVVTYNGASFDLPLLRSRALLNRRRGFLGGLISLDLVVPVRRFWRRTLPDCRQQTVEDLICGLERGPGDIEGRDIPGVWFAFLRGEDDPRLAAVLRHNRRDMLGMACIWNSLLHWLDITDGVVPLPDSGLVDHWSLAWSLGRVSAGRGRVDRMTHWLGMALDLLGDVPSAHRPVAEVHGGFWLDAVQMAKRNRCWLLLARIVETGLKTDDSAVWLHREAAILHEHRLGNLDKALAHALSCREEARVGRLEKKLGPGS